MRVGWLQTELFDCEYFRTNLGAMVLLKLT